MNLIKRHKIFSALTGVLLLGFAALAFAQQGYFPFNGNTFTIRSGGTQTVDSGGTVNWASGSYLKIAGTAVTSSAAEMNIMDGVTATYTEINKLAGVTAGSIQASKALVVGTSRNINTVVVDDTLDTSSALIRVTNGSTLQLDAGSTLSLGGKVTARTQVVLGDSTLMAYTSGTTYVARPVAAKTTLTLPGAAVGLVYEIMGADADSVLVTTASGDSLITSAGAAWKTIATDAGTVKIIAYDTTRWLMVFSLGTWTPY